MLKRRLKINGILTVMAKTLNIALLYI